MGRRHVASRTCIRNDLADAVEGDPGGGGVRYICIALGFFVFAAVALGVNLVQQRDSYGWVQHTNEVLRNISAVEKAILEAESGKRGYLLTGESATSTSYNR
jgi:CHASE3 domain sensor protein